MRYADIGSISTGTLRTEDLLSSFADELEYQLKRCGEKPDPQHEKLVTEARRYICLDSCLEASIQAKIDESGYVLEELTEALQGYTAPYCYFGAIEGDGSDFGFWFDHEAFEQARFDGEICTPDEFDRATDPADFIHVAALYEVNDHGNVTIFDTSGNVLISIV